MLFEAPQKVSYRHVRALNLIQSVALAMDRWRGDPGAFQFIL